LDGRGGEGEEVGGAGQLRARRHLGEMLELSLPVAVPKRQALVLVAISGQRPSPAKLGSDVCRSFFFLRWRIFISLHAASQAVARPSGFVPGSGNGGRVWRLLDAGEMQGLDRVFAIISRVFYVKLQGLVVIFFFIQVLLVIVHPPPMK
jgi:hypothetical protein